VTFSVRPIKERSVKLGEHGVEESLGHRDFNLHHAEGAYQRFHATLYAAHEHFNQEYFSARLSVPHLRYGLVATRKLGDCLPLTGYGAHREIVIHQGLTVAPNPAWVLAPWPAPGLRLFVEDLLLRFTVCQAVREGVQADGSRGEGSEESGYGYFGPRFCLHANQIGAKLGLPQVIVRRAGSQDSGLPLAKFWPHCVRPEGYYGDDLTQAVLDLAAGGNSAGTRQPAPPSLGLLELLLYLLVQNKAERARELLIRHIDRLQQDRLARRPRNSRAERGLADVDKDGTPLGEVEFDPAWLAWNNGGVRKVAEGIMATRSFGELAILADALEEAGCSDGRILRHLRARLEHTRNCWVLRLVLNQEGRNPAAPARSNQ
jgi:hypothetical protein